MILPESTVDHLSDQNIDITILLCYLYFNSLARHNFIMLIKWRLTKLKADWWNWLSTSLYSGDAHDSNPLAQGAEALIRRCG